jgi:hypothetical protein
MEAEGFLDEVVWRVPAVVGWRPEGVGRRWWEILRGVLDEVELRWIGGMGSPGRRIGAIIDDLGGWGRRAELETVVVHGIVS